MAQKKVARARALLVTFLKQGASISKLIELYARAAAGLYCPKLFDDEDLDEDTIALRSGGPRLMYSLNHSRRTGAASSRTVRRRAFLPRFTSMSSTIDKAILEKKL
jgi:hypothetical protein